MAELVLAILPLIISVAEHYEECLAPIQRYLQFSKRVSRFQGRFEIQKTIFQNQCQFLLEEAVDREVAVQMLRDKTHPSWVSRDLDSKLVDQLGVSKEACKTIIGEVQRILKRLEEWSRTLATAMQEDDKSHKLGLKAWTSLVKKKLKFSFSEGKLCENLRELKELNDSFLTLASQTSKLQEHSSRAKKAPCSDPTKVQELLLIQRASRRVYAALGHACSKHTIHRTHLCLEAKAMGTAVSPQVQFKLAFERFAIQQTGTMDVSKFFIIESSFSEASHFSNSRNPDHTTVATKSQKRGVDAEDINGSKRIKKSVRFQEVGSQSSSSSRYPIITPPCKNLCVNKNFCDQLKLHLQQTSINVRYLGALDDIEGYTHLVCALPREESAKRPSLSLRDVIALRSKRSPLSRLSHYERLHLARSLATFVLQYSNTPWLKEDEPWKSDDIFFYDTKEMASLEGAHESLSSPHISVPIRKEHSIMSPSNSSAIRIAPNTLLYNLGVILIELAFNSSMYDMMRISESPSQNSSYSEFVAAWRLANIVSRETGLKYGEIVRKCLGCQFSSGCNLSEKSLQQEYYCDVVSELENPEQEFRAVNLDG